MMRDHGSHGVADQDVAEKHAQHGHHAPAPEPREAHVTSSHDRHAGHSVEMFRNRFWISLALTIPVLLYAQMLWDWAGVDMPDLPAQKVVPFLLGTVVYVYGGSVFVRSAAGELRSRMPGMMTLVALGITTAYVYSAATTFLLEGEGFYWELATLVDVMLLGHWIEMRSIGRARGALGELAKLLPDTAERVTEHGVEEVPASALSVGDVVLVRPGGRVPADGEVVEGSSHVDESMLTGESRPVAKAFGDVVVAGSVNGEGSLRARVTKTGEETALAGIARLVAEAEASKSRAQALADRAASLLTYVAIAAGGATALVWAIAGRDVQFVIERTVTVIVIACPHALGLAVPLVIAIATGLSARSGILVRDRLALERARELDVVVFDKTGTLTKGELGVVGLVTTGDLDEGDALALAAGLESDSEHPLARAIVGEAGRRGLAPVGIEDFQAASGRGVEGRVGGRIVRLGGPKLLEELGVGVPEELGPEVKAWADEGKTVVYLIDGDSIVAAFALADSIREESREAVQALREMGMRVAMITGDSEAVAAWVARELEIEEVFAQVLPEHKAARVKELQERGLRVAMIGDGVNDAPALVQADVGIAIGAGTDVAIEAADVILVRDDPRDVVGVVGLSRASYRKMLQNLAWATGYNVVALPLAAGVLEPVGVTLSPAVGALLMALSTVVVSLNAQLLRRVRLAAEE